MSNRYRLAMRSLFLLLILLLNNSLPFIQAGSSSNKDKVRGECIPYENDLSSFHCHRPSSVNKTSSTTTSSSSSSSCIDENDQCATWFKQGECTSNPHYMLLHCSKSCNSCVSAHAGATQIAAHLNARLVLDHVIQTEHYLREEVMYKVQYLQTCLNRHELCTVWALDGHCHGEHGHEKAEWMQHHCAPACKTCEKTK